MKKTILLFLLSILWMSCRGQGKLSNKPEDMSIDDGDMFWSVDQGTTDKKMYGSTITGYINTSVDSARSELADTAAKLRSEIELGAVTLVGDTIALNNEGLVLIPGNTSNYNTIVGRFSPAFITSSAYRNTFYGGLAGAALTTGDDNTLIGSYTANQLLTGSNNTFIGSMAGTWMQTGSYNIGIGKYACDLYAYHDQNYQLFIESEQSKDKFNSLIWGDMYNDSLRLNGKIMVKEWIKSSSFLFPNGNYLSGESSVKGITFNYASGATPLQLFSNSDGSLLLTGYDNSMDATASYNTYMGILAGSSTTTGYSNSCFGTMAGRYLTTGYQNVLIGISAGVNVTTGYRNVLIGAQAGVGSNYSNTLIIEPIDHGAGNSTQSLLYGNFDTDDLSLNAAVNIRDGLTFSDLGTFTQESLKGFTNDTTTTTSDTAIVLSKKGVYDYVSEHQGISGSISSGQIAVGTGTNEMGGSDHLKWNGTNLYIGNSSYGEIVYRNSLYLSAGDPESPTVFWHINGGGIYGGQSTSYPALLNSISNSTAPVFLPRQSDPNTGIGRADEDQLSLIAGGTEVMRIAAAKTAGAYYPGITNPSSSNRLNFDGNLHLTGIYTYSNSYLGTTQITSTGSYALQCSGQGVSTNGCTGFNTQAGSTAAGIAGTSLDGYCGKFYTYVTDANNGAVLLGLQRQQNLNTYNITGDIIQIIDNPTTSGTISGKILTANVGGTERILFNPRATSGNISYMFDTHVDNTTGKIHEFKNNGTDLMVLYKDSSVINNTIKWNKYTLTDTFALVIYPNNQVDTVSLVYAAGFGLTRPFIKATDALKDQRYGELAWYTKQDGKIEKWYRFPKNPGLINQMQTDGIEMNVRRIAELEKENELLKNDLKSLQIEIERIKEFLLIDNSNNKFTIDDNYNEYIHEIVKRASDNAKKKMK